MAAAHRYTTLDGARGLAAIAVLIFHARVFTGPLQMPSGYLAVDLFFVLSGFVIADAYRARFAAGMSWEQFMRLRIVRLYPLYLAGTLIGMASTAAHLMITHRTGVWPGYGFRAASALAMVPNITTIARAGALFPFNGPAWSLFFELAANAAYAAMFTRLNRAVLFGFVLLAAGALIWIAVSFGTLSLGNDWDKFVGGLARVAFSFFVGVLVHHYRGDRASARAATVLPFALLLVFAARPGHRVLFDLACVLLLFPAFVLVAARVEPGPAVTRLFARMGRYSYAIYAIHAPIISAVITLLILSGKRASALLPLFALATFAAILVLAAVLSDYVDPWARARISRILAKNTSADRKTI